MTDYQRKIQAGKQLPAIFVGCEGYTVDQISGQNKSALLSVRWLIVVAGRDVSSIIDGKPARDSVAEISRRAFARLIGWYPPSGSPMTALNGYLPMYESGLVKFPLVFESKLHIEQEA